MDNKTLKDKIEYDEKLENSDCDGVSFQADYNEVGNFNSNEIVENNLENTNATLNNIEYEKIENPSLIQYNNINNTEKENNTEKLTNKKDKEEESPNKKSKESLVKRIYKIIVYSMSLILMISAPIMLFLVIVERNSNQTPVIFGYSLHIVVTGSMEPEIMIGDLVIAKKTDLEDIQEGDDIVFKTDDPTLNGINIVHRVIKVNGDGTFKTQGVAKGIPEDAYPASKVIGKVVVVSSLVGKIFSTLNENRNYVFAALLAILMIMIISEIIKIMKIQNEKKLEIINAETNKDVLDITKDEEFIKFKQELYAKMMEENNASRKLKEQDACDNTINKIDVDNKVNKDNFESDEIINENNFKDFDKK